MKFKVTDYLGNSTYLFLFHFYVTEYEDILCVYVRICLGIYMKEFNNVLQLQSICRGWFRCHNFFTFLNDL